MALPIDIDERTRYHQYEEDDDVWGCLIVSDMFPPYFEEQVFPPYLYKLIRVSGTSFTAAPLSRSRRELILNPKKMYVLLSR